MIKIDEETLQNHNYKMALLWLFTLLSLNTLGATVVTDTISPPPDIPAAIAGSAEVCQGETAQYFADIPIDCQAQWLVNGVLHASTYDTLTIQWSTPGIHLLVLEALCDTLYTTLDTLQVMVIALPQQPTPITGSSQVCLFASEVYTTEIGEGETCQWFIDGVLQPALTGVISYVWDTIGNHLIEVLATNTCGTSEVAFLVVEVFEMPIVDLGSDTTLVEGQVLVLDAGNPGCSYLWTTGDTSQTIRVNQTGWYEVAVSNGCAEVTNGIQVQVLVGQQKNMFLDEIVIKTRGNLCEIIDHHDVIALICVYDISGKLVTETSGSSIMFRHPGIFILKVKSNDGKTFLRKLVVTNWHATAN